MIFVDAQHTRVDRPRASTAVLERARVADSIVYLAGDFFATVVPAILLRGMGKSVATSGGTAHAGSSSRIAL